MSLAVGRTKLLDAYKVLMTRWDVVQRTWNDPQQRAFEKAYLERLESELRMAVGAIETMQATVERARAECSDTGGFHA